MNMTKFLSDFNRDLKSRGIKATVTVVSDISIPHDYPPKPKHLQTCNVEQKPVFMMPVVETPIYSNSKYKGD